MNKRQDRSPIGGKTSTCEWPCHESCLPRRFSAREWIRSWAGFGAYFLLLASSRGEAIPACGRFAELVGAFAEEVEREQRSTGSADLHVLGTELSDADGELRIFFDDCPGESADFIPSIVEARRDLDCVTDQIDAVDRIAFVIREFNVDPDHEHVVCDLLAFQLGPETEDQEISTRTSVV